MSHPYIVPTNIQVELLNKHRKKFTSHSCLYGENEYWVCNLRIRIWKIFLNPKLNSGLFMQNLSIMRLTAAPHFSPRQQKRRKSTFLTCIVFSAQDPREFSIYGMDVKSDQECGDQRYSNIWFCYVIFIQCTAVQRYNYSTIVVATFCSNIARSGILVLVLLSNSTARFILTN
jgi:hypothetical protein